MDYPLHIVSPYPTIDASGTMHDGFMMKQCSFCTDKCQDRTCTKFNPTQANGSVDYVTCPFGFTVALAKIGQSVLRINGMIETETCTARPDFKKRHKSRKLRAPALESWIRKMIEGLPAYEAAIQQIANDSISALHEIKAIIGTVLRTTENWIWSQSGQDLDEKLENGPEELRTIYHSCRILESLLQMTDIIANPAAATFGAPGATPIHKVLLLLTRVFEARAAARSITITPRGSSYNRPRTYRSFIIVPLVLLDNAIKHSDPGTEIFVSMSDRLQGAVWVEISSYGPVIPKNERTSVFQRGVRGSNVIAAGSGLGLFVAQAVAEANGFTISYEARPSAPNRGINALSFTVTGI